MKETITPKKIDPTKLRKNRMVAAEEVKPTMTIHVSKLGKRTVEKIEKVGNKSQVKITFKADVDGKQATLTCAAKKKFERNTNAVPTAVAKKK